MIFARVLSARITNGAFQPCGEYRRKALFVIGVKTQAEEYIIYNVLETETEMRTETGNGVWIILACFAMPRHSHIARGSYRKGCTRTGTKGGPAGLELELKIQKFARILTPVISRFYEAPSGCGGVFTESSRFLNRVYGKSTKRGRIFINYSYISTAPETAGKEQENTRKQLGNNSIVYHNSNRGNQPLGFPVFGHLYEYLHEHFHEYLHEYFRKQP